MVDRTRLGGTIYAASDRRFPMGRTLILRNAVKFSTRRKAENQARKFAGFMGPTLLVAVEVGDRDYWIRSEKLRDDSQKLLRFAETDRGGSARTPGAE